VFGELKPQNAQPLISCFVMLLAAPEGVLNVRPATSKAAFPRELTTNNLYILPRYFFSETVPILGGTRLIGFGIGCPFLRMSMGTGGFFVVGNYLAISLTIVASSLVNP
jgi:hypothetical protein